LKTQENNQKNQVQASAETFRAEGLSDSFAPVQMMPNRTGMPDNLKAGIENLSGYSMNDVKVHYNSSQPAQLNAHAYAQGSNIHLAPGQERHLPHEAWHVVQQKQGRVKATTQMKGKIPVNDEAGLEHEADVMGAKALSADKAPFAAVQQKALSTASAPVQAVAQLRHVGLFGLEAEVVGNRFEIMYDPDLGDEFEILNDPEVILEEYSLGDVFGEIDITLDNEAKGNQDGLAVRSYTVEFIQKPLDILGESSESDIAVKWAAWEMVKDFWETVFKDSGKTLSSIMDKKDDWMGGVNDKWEGGQFDKHKGNSTVETRGAEDEDKSYHFDWKKTLNGINVESKDPQVSPQLTAGASLIAADKAFLATHSYLYRKESFSKEKGEALKIKGPKDEKEQSLMEVRAFLGIMGRYLQATRPKPQTQKRYMKEYVPMMVRNSLDAVYNGMSAGGRALFRSVATKYLNGEPGNYVLKTLKVAPEEQVFLHAGIKEAPVITMEQLLFSIFKIKRGEEGELEDDEAAGPGDAFVQGGLVGISEINETDPGTVAKFGLQSPDEMMSGIKGVIFENRLAKTLPLSEMPTLFMESVKALQIVNEMMEGQHDEQ